MTDHIDSRIDILINASKPHMFIAELQLYKDYLKGEMAKICYPGNLINRKNIMFHFFKTGGMALLTTVICLV